MNGAYPAVYLYSIYSRT